VDAGAVPCPRPLPPPRRLRLSFHPSSLLSLPTGR
jgi:hypothetical protein